MLKLRLITSSVLISLVIVILFWLPLSGFTAVMFAVCILATWEWGKLAGFTSRLQLIWLSVLCGLMIVLTLFTIPTYCYYNIVQLPQFSSSLSASFDWWIIALLMVLSYPNSADLWRQSRALRLLFGMLTIIPFFFSMIAIRQYQYGINHFIGSWWLLYIIVLICGADSGAYVFGRLFGKHELAPKISPRKTWEGFFGGIFIAMLIAWLFSQMVLCIVPPSILLSSSIISILASTIGDLTASMFKREAGMKDSGHLFPGHGGILDRIDSLTAAVPIFFCLMLTVFKEL